MNSFVRSRKLIKIDDVKITFRFDKNAKDRVRRMEDKEHWFFGVERVRGNPPAAYMCYNTKNLFQNFRHCLQPFIRIFYGLRGDNKIRNRYFDETVTAIKCR